MKECTACNEVKELDEFSPQKTKPGKLYAWCDVCRKSQNTVVRNNGYRKEMRELKNKAKELRAFSPEQAAEIKAKFEGGIKVKQLAAETGRSESAIYKAIKGYNKNVSLKPALKPNPFA